MSELRYVLQSGLPKGMHIDTLVREQDIFVVQLRDPEGKIQTIEFWEKNKERKAYKTGRMLAFAYRPSLNTASTHEVERRLIDTWATEDEPIAIAARGFVEPPVVRPAPGRPLFLRESAISLRVARVLPRAGSIVRAVRDAFDDEFSAMSAPDEVQVYFESACAQACEFCEEPQKRVLLHRRALQRLLVLQHETRLDVVSSGIFRELVGLAAEHGLPVRITGHDWTRHPHREELLRVLETCDRAKIRLQGPSLAFDSPSLAQRIAGLPGLEWVATTLQSSDPDEHDVMVGVKGAQVRLLKALDNLALCGVQVILTVVLTRRAVRSLRKTLEFVKERGWRVELATFVPDRSMQHVQEKLVPIDELRLALDDTGAIAHDVVASLVGVPHCAVPKALRSKIASALATRERDPMQFGLVCRTCTQQKTCPGIVAGYVEVFGERGLAALGVGKD